MVSKTKFRLMTLNLRNKIEVKNGRRVAGMSSPLLRLRILHSNDIHSHFEQMPKIAAAFQELRTAVGKEHTLTLDIGDHLDRVRAETEGSAGEANLDIMAATGYEAI